MCILAFTGVLYRMPFVTQTIEGICVLALNWTSLLSECVIHHTTEPCAGCKTNTEIKKKSVWFMKVKANKHQTTCGFILKYTINSYEKPAVNPPFINIIPFSTENDFHLGGSCLGWYWTADRWCVKHIQKLLYWDQHSENRTSLPHVCCLTL